ncbi:MAG: 4-hydroxy-tetrahydrodipicolinate synthase [Gammaproteobacteria bacterium]|nr:4-hydroxy-tetrahydrodipicolinate synthase [Gammaproteobacteria bacterium]MCP5459220.1 4-hydroxy-tetrahydrodipicolinate synthase [Gammaproteobacteria bacterium]
MFQVQGSIVALVTPMAADGGLDFGALERLIEFHLENGTDAIVAVGTTGESATLDHEEHCVVIRRVVEQVKGRCPVIAGTGANSTREALDLTRCAMQAGADACLLVTPYYNKPTQEGLFQHYKLIAETLPIPQILYNVPGRTACDMRPETVDRLADLPNIVGIKEASGSVERMRELVARCGDRLSVFSGDDGIGTEAMLNGAKGVISVTANVAPKTMHAMCAAALAGDRATAEELNSRLAALHKALFLESNPIPAKWAVARLGLIPPGIRLPLTPLSSQFHGDVEQAMRQAGVF